MLWDAASHALGVAEMDDTHREFLSYVNALSAASAADFPALFEQLRAHTRKHFERESQHMLACRFPALREHEAEHARVLADLTHLSTRVQQGQQAMARAYVNGLAEWFRTHLATMDSALAACLKARQADTATL
jgi:hemerythrin-like metal-binding protein